LADARDTPCFVEEEIPMTTKHVKKIVKKSELGRAVLFALIFLGIACGASGKPVTYTGFTITDGKLGSWSFHNARVYLRVDSDTQNVKFMQPNIDPAHPSYGTVDTWINPTGDAYVTIISGKKVETAQFDPNQIFVAVDLGDTVTAPHLGGRGMGFGSFTATGGFEPAYPLGIEDGTVAWGEIVHNGVPSPELQSLSTDLMNNMGFSGRAWSCVGFPGTPCKPPTALHTDKGDLYLNLPYSQSPGFGLGETVNGGFFLAELTESDRTGRHGWSFNAGFFPPESLTATRTDHSAHPISYYGYVIADVSLGDAQYPGAQVYFSFESDTSSVTPFSVGHGYSNGTGSGNITIIGGSKTVSARLEPGQIYVYYDIDHASMGFGFNASHGSRESGYPLSITANKDSNGLVENSLIGAVSDIILHGDTSNYSPATATLVTNLKNATMVSGAASSCLGFDPVSSTCANLTPAPLKTNRGDFKIYEPYRDGAFSVNWGVFWAETPAERRVDRKGESDGDDSGHSH
jgi:hypothetical protein